MDYKITEEKLNSFTNGCPTEYETDYCKPVCQSKKCWIEYLTGLVHESCIGIVQTSTVDRITAKAERLLEE